MSTINKKSFTLIELLIAVTIITLVILSVYSAFNTGILAYKKIDSVFDTYQEARIILNRIEADLRNSFAYSEESSFFKGSSSTLDFFNISEIYDKDKQYSDLCRIKYYLEGSTLKRRTYNGLAAMTDDENIEAQDFSSSVKNIDFEYAYLSDDDRANIVWQNVWPQKDEQAQGLPLAVKIKLLLIDRGAKQQGLLEFTKTIALAQGNVFAAEEK
ncbi:MAG: prepilin-type N-terminal cleavage/methylation domain-containing protein [Candidatus Omnitrophica bacterium]|jgi:type II secretory pathway component PulJ|nr:prepilin-type N-terminal cleavage/methylation domain-containing protein [Candidatus Omnitrophota bacterium]